MDPETNVGVTLTSNSLRNRFNIPVTYFTTETGDGGPLTRPELSRYKTSGGREGGDWVRFERSLPLPRRFVVSCDPLCPRDPSLNFYLRGKLGDLFSLPRRYG